MLSATSFMLNKTEKNIALAKYINNTNQHEFNGINTEQLWLPH